jgi:FdrA protein
VLLGLLGDGRPDLTATARRVVEAAGATWSPPEHWPGKLRGARSGGRLSGLFTGGTLCDEARLIAADRLGADRYSFVDFGADEYTRGRPHPMIDGSLRIERMVGEIDDGTAAVLLLDVVLGLGADPDPAGSLADPVRRATDAGVPVVVSVVGTRDDPQDTARQCRVLHEAGATVHLSNADAARTALDLLEGR